MDRLQETGLLMGGARFEPVDLRAKLDEALQAGWSIRALKAYAYHWRYTRPQRDHVTRAAWRMAVSLTTERDGLEFLERYNADRESYDAFVK